MRIGYKLFLVCCMSICLIACSRITEENFTKVKAGMTMEEVKAILGTPSSAESVDIAGVSGTSAVWKDSQAEIDIQFLNNKVTIKTFSKLDPQKTD